MLQRLVGDGQLVVGLVAVPQAPENGQGGVRIGLMDGDGLKAPLQRGVFFDIPAVFVQRGGPHHLDLPPAQGGLDDVGRVDGTLGAARPHDGVQLIEEEDHVPGPADLGQHVFHPLLKLAPVLGARHHAGQVQGHDPLAPQVLGHLAGDDAPGQALGNGGLAHAGFPDEGGVVLLPPGQDLDDPADFFLPADDRVQGAIGRHAGQIPGELVQQLGVPPLGVVPLRLGPAGAAEGGRGLPAQSAHQVVVKPFELHAAARQDPGGHAVPLPQQAQQQVLGAHVAVAQSGGLRHGQLNDLFATGGQPLGGHGDRGSHPHQPGNGAADGLGLQTGVAQHLGGHALPLPGQAQQQVLGAHVAVTQLGGGLLCQTQGGLGPLGESVFADGTHSLEARPDWEARGVLDEAGPGSARRRGSRAAWAALWEAPSSSGVREPASSAEKRFLDSLIKTPLKTGRRGNRRYCARFGSV